jgi:hypothetical protein
VYPVPPGPLPITGFDMLGFGLVGTVLLAAGVLLLRIAYFARSKS